MNRWCNKKEQKYFFVHLLSHFRYFYCFWCFLSSNIITLSICIEIQNIYAKLGATVTTPPYWIVFLGLSIARYTTAFGSFIGAAPKSLIYSFLAYTIRLVLPSALFLFYLVMAQTSIKKRLVLSNLSLFLLKTFLF